MAGICDEAPIASIDKFGLVNPGDSFCFEQDVSGYFFGVSLESVTDVEEDWADAVLVSHL